MTGPISCLLLAVLPAQPPGPQLPGDPGPFAETGRLAVARPAAPTDDRSAAALAAFEEALTAYFGGTRQIPLAEKAAYYDWVIRRHHLELFAPKSTGAQVGIVHQTAFLPKTPGGEGTFNPGPDTLTWNGALLAAMSYRYAVTRDPAALEWVRTLIYGLELGMEVTGQKGLPARCFTQSDKPVGSLTMRYRPANGPVIYVHSDAAKGTVNQIAGGLIVCQLLCGSALDPVDLGRAQRLSLILADHLVRHDYHLTEANGKRTEYGDITPRLGPQSIPFNAQVAYLVVAGGAGLGANAPNIDPNAVRRVKEAFEDLRAKHHVYYEVPTQLVRPQRIGASAVVKGMNDRHHVFTAGYTALLLEWELARSANTAADGQFLYEMGRTPLYAMRGVRGERNSLLSFLWGGLLMDGRRAAAILPDPREQQAEFAIARHEIEEGVEHLRRFPLSRRSAIVEKNGERPDVWVVEQRPWDCYVWKANPNLTYRQTGPVLDKWAAGIDYLHAYWAARYWGLPGVQ
ncbi:hypothetical protein [Alienimonas chondri]|uniref:Alginate lyase domain-containing protein n=1 Tax=Alienimonas chondri TaxID=2681879 RepID=A0ABX1V8S2_9PLAN|nr:hypothetical protein [Alienimonas chondri]NNJ24228.1 hypothetical protein [Alienimonas chondri]